MTDIDALCLDRYLTGQASEADVLSLGARLRSDAALRKELLILAAFDAELPGALRDVASEKKEKARVTVATFPAAGARRARVRMEARRPVARRLLWSAAIAAGILVVVGSIAYLTGRSARPGRTELATTAPPPPPAAAPDAVAAAMAVAKPEGRLTEIRGEAWVARADGEGQPVPAEVGRQVFAGEAIVTGTNATAQFAFVDGSLLQLYRRSAVVLSRDGEGPGIDLRAGALDATVRPRQPAESLRVLGALMQAEIVGTEFRLMAHSETKSKWLGVRKGVVEVSRVADGQKVVLQDGNYAAVAPNWPYMRMDARVCPVWKEACRRMAGTAYP